MPLDFSARYSAAGKLYHYNVRTAAILDPFTRDFETHEVRPLDVPLMRYAQSPPIIDDAFDSRLYLLHSVVYYCGG